MVAEFLDVPLENANNALQMAVQLGLLELPQGADEYRPCSILARYLVTGSDVQKTAVLRLLVESFPPFRAFKQRLELTGLPATAAQQTRALCGLAAHHDEISATLCSIGTYTNSLVTGTAGRVTVNTAPLEDPMQALNGLTEERESAEFQVRNHLSPQVADWCNTEDVVNPLVTAFLVAQRAAEDPHPPVIHAANAFESFLTQIAQSTGVNVDTRHGINAKADYLKQQQVLQTKHLNVIKYLGHIRNAADHGIDPEIDTSWAITAETSKLYVAVALTAIRTIHTATVDGEYRL